MPYKDPAAKKAHSKRYYGARKSEQIQYQREWRKRFPEKDRALRLREYAYLRADPERRARRAENARQQRILVRRVALAMYGNGKCACCGEMREEFLAIDHINGGGSKDRKAGLSSTRLYSRLIASYHDGYRVLCHNCNLARGFYGYCPHEKAQ